MPIKNHVIQFIGYKNSGKTTLVCAMAERLSSMGFRVGAVKHDAHEFEMDRPGTDTWKLGLAGADKVAITSPHQTAMLEKGPSTLEHLIDRMADVDVVLAEGFKQAHYPKFVLIRSREDIGLLESSANVIAGVSWVPVEYGRIPVIGIGETDRVLELLLLAIGGNRPKEGGGSC